MPILNIIIKNILFLKLRTYFQLYNICPDFLIYAENFPKKLKNKRPVDRKYNIHKNKT